jgi:hypothetical protein
VLRAFTVESDELHSQRERVSFRDWKELGSLVVFRTRNAIESLDHSIRSELEKKVFCTKDSCTRKTGDRTVREATAYLSDFFGVIP